jgi:caa(3)-type oxidase subunit IV
MSEDHEHSHTDYWKIYKWLVVLFLISVAGPWLAPGIKVIVLLTAFGIALVKAMLVVSNFMHLNVEKKFVWFLFLACLFILLVFFAGVAPDVLNKSGNNWVSDSAAMVTHHGNHQEDQQAEQPLVVSPENTNSAGTGPVAKGKELFNTKACFACHQTDPEVPALGGVALKAPKFMGDFWGQEREVELNADPDSATFMPSGKFEKVVMDEAYVMESIEKPNLKVVKGALAAMAPLPTNAEERRALAEYIKSLSK